MTFIDTHAHLYLPEFTDDLAEMITRTHASGVQKVFLPAIDSEAIPSMLALEKQYPETCFAMMGVHPCSIKSGYQEELNVAEDWLKKRAFWAIGEIGLDFYWDKTFIKEQYAAFESQISWALAYDLPIVIHSRDAGPECLEVVKKYQQGSLRGIFHCFGGDYNLAKGIIDAGFLLGIGGVLTYKNAGLPPVLEKIGLEYMVLETDAPYLSPVPFRGKRNESSYIRIIAEKLAAVKAVPLETVAEVTTANAKALFRWQ